MTGLHPHGPGCHRASAEVSWSETLSGHQLQAAVLQLSLPSDLILSGKVCSSLGNWWGGACHLSHSTNCCVVIARISLGSRLTPTQLLLLLFSKGAFFLCEANNQGDDHVIFKALQQHVIMSIYISVRGRIQHAAASAYEYQTCVKLKRRKQKTCTQAVQLFLLNCIHLHGNDRLWQWKVWGALICLKR